MGLGEDFRFVGDLPDRDQGDWAYSAVYECPECFALLLGSHTEKHEAWHRKQQTSSGPVIEIRWDSDDYAVFYVNGQRAGFYDHDLHGRDGLEAALRLAEETARILGGEFRSDN